MASLIRIKRSSVKGNPSTLAAGELAYSALPNPVGVNNGGDMLYIGMGTETVPGQAANHVVIGGKYFTDKLMHTPGVLTADTALIVDADKKINELNVDNITINGNSIVATDSGGDLTLQANGTANVKILGTSSLVIPVGADIQRGAEIDGAIRYNTDKSAFEGFGNGNWASLGGVKSVDGNTYIKAEATPNNGDNTLFFRAGSVDQMKITPAKIHMLADAQVQISNTTNSTSVSTGALTVAGGVGIASDLFVGGTLNIGGGISLDGAAGSTNFDGDITVDGGEIYSAATTFNVLNKVSPSSVTTDGPATVNAFLNASTLNIGATTGTTTVNNNVTVTGDLTVSGNDIKSSAGTVITFNNTDITTAGNVTVGGNVIKSSGGTALTLSTNDVTVEGDLTVKGNGINSSTGTAITLSGSSVTTVGDLTVGGNHIKTGSGILAMTLTAGSGLVSFNSSINISDGKIFTPDADINPVLTLSTTGNGLVTTKGNLQVGGNVIKSSAGDTALTLSTNDVTVEGDLTVKGNDIKSSGGNTAITLSAADVEVKGNLQVTGNTIKSSGAATVFTLSGSNVTAAGTVTATGATTLNDTLDVKGATTIGTSGTHVATNVYATTFVVDADDSSSITMTGNAANAALDISAPGSNAALNLSSGSTLTAASATTTVTGTDALNLTLNANDANDKTLAINASNTGAGEANIVIGTSSDNVSVSASNAVNITAPTLNVNGDVAVTGGTTFNVTTTGANDSISLTSGATSVKSGQVDITAENGTDATTVNVTGQLNVDNVRITGSTISSTDAGNTLYIDPNPVGNNGTLVIKGNLQVDGETITVNSTTVTVDDPVFTLGGETAPTLNDHLDRGIEYKWHDGTNAKVGFFGYNELAAEFAFLSDATSTAGVYAGTYGTGHFGAIKLSDTTTSTTVGTGALVVSGGVGISGQLNVGGTTNKFTSTQNSTSTTTGSIVTAGGVGIAQSVTIGGDITGSGTSALNDFVIDGGEYV